MKKTIIIGLALALSACGEHNDMYYNKVGSDSPATNPSKPSNPSRPSEPSTPTNPDSDETGTEWGYYSGYDSSDILFTLDATNYATNTFDKPGYDYLEGRPWVKLQKMRYLDGKIENTVVIFTDADMACLPSCDLLFSFDGNWATYRMTNVINGAIKPIDEATEITLFKKFTSTNKATVRLPIIGLSQPFDANFDLRGYDMKRMKF